MSIDTHVIKADWHDHQAVLQELRRKVFIEEQSVPQELEWDGQDDLCTHFLAINTLGEYIGCARLMPSGQIGRMAVLQEHRGNGIGALLLEAAVEEGREQGLERLFLHAQSYAEPFYRKGGFLPCGPQFIEAGIDHVPMELMLPFAFTPPPTKQGHEPKVRPQAVRPPLAGPAEEPMAFSDQDQAGSALLKVLESARRRVRILSPHLDHELFDTLEVAQTLSNLARSAPKVEIQILIFSSKLMVERGHRLLELARRLDEKITIRKLAEQPNAEASSFVCADLDAYWLLPSHEKPVGVAELTNPVTSKRLSEAFELAWEKSREDGELRLLRL